MTSAPESIVEADKKLSTILSDILVCRNFYIS